MNIKEAQDRVAAFAAERGWDVNLASQRGEHLVREIGRLMEYTLYMEGVTTKAPTGTVEKQLGDVLFSLLSMANHVGVDVEEQLRVAMKEDAAKYPASEERREESLRAYTTKMRPMLSGLDR